MLIQKNLIQHKRIEQTRFRWLIKGIFDGYDANCDANDGISEANHDANVGTPDANRDPIQNTEQLNRSTTRSATLTIQTPTQTTQSPAQLFNLI